MRINRATVFEIAKDTYRIEMLGRINCYMLIGSERGMLIDCGFGLEPVKPLIDELCELPYDVCITHADGDHMGACCEWDQVWLHPADLELAHDLDHVNFQRLTGQYTSLNPMIVADDRSEFQKYYHLEELDPVLISNDNLPEFLPLYDGQIFHLGNRDVTVVNVTGHTMGSCVFIDPASRIMFSGDAISSASDIKLITATEGLRNMETLLSKYGSMFDRIYPAHTGLGPGAKRMNFSLPKSIIEDYKTICKQIIDGTVDIKVENQAQPNPDFPQDEPTDIFQGLNLNYNPDKKQSEGVAETAHPVGYMEHFNFRADQI